MHRINIPRCGYFGVAYYHYYLENLALLTPPDAEDEFYGHQVLFARQPEHNPHFTADLLPRYGHIGKTIELVAHLCCEDLHAGRALRFGAFHEDYAHEPTCHVTTVNDKGSLARFDKLLRKPGQERKFFTSQLDTFGHLVEPAIRNFFKLFRRSTSVIRAADRRPAAEAFVAAYGEWEKEATKLDALLGTRTADSPYKLTVEECIELHALRAAQIEKKVLVRQEEEAARLRVGTSSYERDLALGRLLPVWPKDGSGEAVALSAESFARFAEGEGESSWAMATFKNKAAVSRELGARVNVQKYFGENRAETLQMRQDNETRHMLFWPGGRWCPNCPRGEQAMSKNPLARSIICRMCGGFHQACSGRLGMRTCCRAEGHLGEHSAD